MASEEEGNGGAKDLHPVSDYGTRAALALHVLLPSPHRAKAVQRLFDVSERMSKYLLRGQHWTTGRLTQAGMVIAGFDAMIASPEHLRQRLGELEAEIAAMKERIRGGGQ